MLRFLLYLTFHFGGNIPTPYIALPNPKEAVRRPGLRRQSSAHLRRGGGAVTEGGCARSTPGHRGQCLCRPPKYPSEWPSTPNCWVLLGIRLLVFCLRAKMSPQATYTRQALKTQKSCMVALPWRWAAATLKGSWPRFRSTATRYGW